MATNIPNWLDAPPDKFPCKPPVISKGQGLPFNDLSWENFERLILRLVRREGAVQDCSMYGTPGQTQYGIDILALFGSSPPNSVCYQCKKVEKFGPADIRDAIDEFLKGKWVSSVQTFVLCVSRPLETTQQRDEIELQRTKLTEKNIKFQIWDGSEGGQLCERLKQLPELVDDFFGRVWVTAFNGARSANDLGERLDGIDLDRLRQRLQNLYAVLFNQHDPGIRAEGGHCVDYLSRYVPADVIEHRAISTRGGERKPDRDMQNRQTAGADLYDRPPENSRAISSVESYETRRPALEWLGEQQLCVVLGEPGAGKSALLRHLALSLLRPDVLPQGQLTTVLLRQLPAWLSFAGFVDAIGKKPDCSVEDYFHDWLHSNSFGDLQDLFKRALYNSEIILLVDGLDEGLPQAAAQKAIDRIVAFTTAHSAAVICTSRPREYNVLGVPSTWQTATLALLNDEQILAFATRWLTIVELEGAESAPPKKTDPRAQSRAESFLAAVRVSQRTHQLARTPLLCQTLIELFRTSHRLPEERVAVYEKIIELLLERHPSARVRAAGSIAPQQLTGMRPRDIKEIVIRLAMGMQLNIAHGLFNRQQCEKLCAEYLEDEIDGLGQTKTQARHQAEDVVTQLLSHFGLLVERAPNQLGFVHLSIQEFLAAEAICRQTEEEQLAFVRRAWLDIRWSECLINWFGFQSYKGKKQLAGQAAESITQLGTTGEFERIQSLQLRTNLACTDLGLPVSIARKVVLEAAVDVEISPFSEHRVALAKYLTLGALGSAVRSECVDVLQKWVPGRNTYVRAATLTQLQAWAPADDLKATLLRAIHDEDRSCRVAAAITFSKVFGPTEEACTTLTRLALGHTRPEVRAAALKGLAEQADWAESALDAANSNISSCNVELMLAVIGIRVREAMHNDDDLNVISRLWQNDAVHYSQKDEFLDLLCHGWPQRPSIRKAFIEKIERRPGPRVNFELSYLIHNYPNDEEIANIIAKRIKMDDHHFSSDIATIWAILWQEFRGHHALMKPIRNMLIKHRENYEAIHWGPDIIDAYIVLGDLQARDELLACYEPGSSMDKLRIAKALITGWPQDIEVLNILKNWANGNLDVACPLVQWAGILFDQKSEQKQWLVRLAKNSTGDIAARTLFALLEAFPDDETQEIIAKRLDSEDFWFYEHVRLESKLACINPGSARSLALYERSLSEPDGPPINGWAASVQNLPEIRARLLVAVAPAALDVRAAIFETLRTRIASSEQLNQLTQNIFSEENSAVRATGFLALAQEAKTNPQLSENIIQKFLAELSSQGHDFHARRRIGFVALLELGMYDAAVQALMAENKGTIPWNYMFDRFYDPDPVSAMVLIKHWQALIPTLAINKLSTILPIERFLSSDYGLLLEMTAETQLPLDNYLQNDSISWFNPEKIELLARRFPRSELLQSKLIEILRNVRNHYSANATRLLTKHFAGDVATWAKIVAEIKSSNQLQIDYADGLLGFLAIGWRDAQAQSDIAQMLPKDSAAWGTADTLLMAVVRGDGDSAELAAKKILAEPFVDGYSPANTHALQAWVQELQPNDVLQKWVDSNDCSLSMTAISLFGSDSLKHLREPALRERFNQQFNATKGAMDGFDGVSRRTHNWCIRVLPTISPAFDS